MNRITDCKDKCSICCRWAFFDIDPSKLDKDTRWLNEARGMIHFKKCIAVPSVCMWLEDDKCKLQGRKPIVCIKFNCKNFRYKKELEKIKNEKRR